MATHFSFLLPLANTLLLLLFHSSTGRITGEPNTDIDVVLDMNRTPLDVDSEYYIISGKRGIFDWRLKSFPRPGDDSFCPFYVVELPIDLKKEYLDLGTPVKFVPSDETQTQIFLSSQVRIDSLYSQFCNDDGIWRMRLNPNSLRDEVIATGAYDVPRSWFMMKKLGSPQSLTATYKIVQCPIDSSSSSSSSTTELSCMDLGTFVDSSGLKLVGVTNNSDDVLQVSFFRKRTEALPYRATN